MRELSHCLVRQVLVAAGSRDSIQLLCQVHYQDGYKNPVTIEIKLLLFGAFGHFGRCKRRGFLRRVREDLG